jgi:hypothetical protein
MNHSLLMSAIAMAVGTSLLSLQIWVMTRINHGVSRPRRRRSRRVNRYELRPDNRYSIGAANSRILYSDDSHDRSSLTAHRLVDGNGVRRVPRDHARHLDGVRLPGAGSSARANVRSLPCVATEDDQSLGRVTPASRQVTSNLPRTAPVL